jgi:hypothetical protein
MTVMVHHDSLQNAAGGDRPRSLASSRKTPPRDRRSTPPRRQAAASNLNINLMEGPGALGKEGSP